MKEMVEELVRCNGETKHNGDLAREQTDNTGVQDYELYLSCLG